MQSGKRVTHLSTNPAIRPRASRRRAAFAALTLVVPGAMLTACGRESGPVTEAPSATTTAEIAQVVTPFFVVPPTDTPMPTATPTIPPTPEFIDGIPTSPEQTATTALLQGEQGVYGVMAFGPDGRIIVTRNAHVPFVAASTYKLVVMADILRKVEAGELSLQ
ncbi:MAG: hypothetical protein E6R14_07010, partial [Thermomicrobiales bacterium]